MLLDAEAVKTVFAVHGKRERVSKLVPLLVPRVSDADCNDASDAEPAEPGGTSEQQRMIILQNKVGQLLLGGQPFSTMLAAETLQTLLANHPSLLGPAKIAELLSEAPRLAQLLFLGCDLPYLPPSYDGDVVWSFTWTTTSTSTTSSHSHTSSSSFRSSLHRMQRKYNPLSDVLTRERDIGFAHSNTNLFRMNVDAFLRRKLASFAAARRLDVQLRMLLALEMELVDERGERLLVGAEESDIYGIAVQLPWRSALGGVAHLVRRMRDLHINEFQFCEFRAIEHLSTKLRHAAAKRIQKRGIHRLRTKTCRGRRGRQCSASSSAGEA